MKFIVRLLTAILFFARMAAEASSWSSPSLLDAQDAREGAVAVDAQGNAFAIWIASVGETNAIQTARQPMGGSWTKPFTLSPEGQNGAHPRIAVDPQGNAVALWTVGEDTHAIVQAATLCAGAQEWIPADHDLTPALDLSSNPPQLAGDADGNALAIWACRHGDQHFIQGARLKLGSHVWTSFAGPARSFVGEIQLALNPSGRAVMVWRSSDNSLLGAVLPTDSMKFKLTSSIASSYQTVWSHTLDIDSAGNAVLLFRFDKGGYPSVYGATLPAKTNAWSTRQKLGSGNDIQLAVAPSGYAVALWHDAASSTLHFATLPIGSTSWSKASTFSKIVPDASIQVAIDNANNAYAFWVNSGTDLQVATMPYEGQWSPPLSLAPMHLSKPPSIAFSSKNRCTALISEGSGGVKALHN